MKTEKKWSILSLLFICLVIVLIYQFQNRGSFTNYYKGEKNEYEDWANIPPPDFSLEPPDNTIQLSIGEPGSKEVVYIDALEFLRAKRIMEEKQRQSLFELQQQQKKEFRQWRQNYQIQREMDRIATALEDIALNSYEY